MKLPLLPEPMHGFYAAPMFTDAQMRAYGEACAAAERERWIGGARVQIPTETMEAEFAAQRRLGAMQERERWTKPATAALEVLADMPTWAGSGHAYDLLSAALDATR